MLPGPILAMQQRARTRARPAADLGGPMTVQAYEFPPPRLRALLGSPVAVGIAVFVLGAAAVLLAPMGTRPASPSPPSRSVRAVDGC